jgi:hypothetical protein
MGSTNSIVYLKNTGKMKKKKKMRQKFRKNEKAENYARRKNLGHVWESLRKCIGF